MLLRVQARRCVFKCSYFCQGDRSNNFVVGLTDVSPAMTPPALWNYTVCGQYPGAVAKGATVTLKCACNTPPHRYLIVQFPRHDYSNICEVEVYIRSEYAYDDPLLSFTLITS